MHVSSHQMRSAALTVAAVVGAATLAVACADADDHPVSSSNVASTGNVVTVPISAVTTSLVDPGSDPLEVVSPQLAPGVHQNVTLDTDFRVNQQIDDQPNQDFSAPPLTIPLTATQNKDGVDLTLGKIATPDAHLASDVGASTGSHAGLTLDSQGAVTVLRIEPAPKAADSARSAIEQAFYQAVYQSISYPQEPIGVGAVWTVKRQITGSINLDQTTTATLLARDGDRLTVRLDVDQTPRTPEWNLPNGAGILHIDDYAMRGTGTVTTDLTLPLPVAGDITVGGAQSYSDPERTTHLKQTTSNRIRWS